MDHPTDDDRGGGDVNGADAVERSGGAAYADAVRRIPQVLERVEAWLASLPNRASVMPLRALEATADISTVYDQIALALLALEAVGVLTRGPDALLRLDREQLDATRPFRVGIRIGVMQASAADRIGEVPRLVAALPRGLAAECVDAVRREADDLRAELIGLVTAAREEVLLASPFWDDETVGDLEDLLRRRLDARVRIDLLGRRPLDAAPRPPRGFARLAAALAPYPDFRALVWEEPLPDDPFGTQTFHFKCALVDHGRLAYLGTANLTLASLRSRMELGVILTGEAAERLFRVVRTILEVARPWTT